MSWSSSLYLNKSQSQFTQGIRDGEHIDTNKFGRFEKPPSTASTIKIIYGPCSWRVHTDLFAARCWTGPLSRSCHDSERSGHTEKQIELDNDGVFIFARLLQFVYYGTYSRGSDDTIAADTNLTRPGRKGSSPAMIVDSGLVDPYDPGYKAMRSQDDHRSEDFGHEIDLALYNMATKFTITDLSRYSLHRYSSFPSRNHREFYIQ